MKYPYGYCGMPCALCSRYRTDGKSRCEGCSFGGYYTNGCKVHFCCTDKKILQCGLCDVFPCKRVENMGEFSDLRTHNAKSRTSKAVLDGGFEKWYSEYELRADLLTEALEKYNDGRMKRYLCELFIQQNILVLNSIMEKAEALTGDKKEKAKAFKIIVNSVIGENI